MATIAYDYNAFDPNAFNAEDGPVTLLFEAHVQQTEVISSPTMPVVRAMLISIQETEYLTAYMRRVSSNYTPPLTPNVNLVFKNNDGTVYTPPISPNVNIIFGLDVNTTSGAGEYNANSSFFLTF